jgi:glycosyltransferase involved in cell wall biosynthesis
VVFGGDREISETTADHDPRVAGVISTNPAYLMNSESEGLPVALIEYGLSKKPVVSTNVGEIPLIIKDGINGFIVDANDAGLFYQKVVRFITESDLRAQMGDSLYQTVIQNNSEEGVIANYLNWILSL